jgi:hypothetical protein
MSSSKLKHYVVVYPEDSKEIPKYLPFLYDQLPEGLQKEIIETYHAYTVESLELKEIVLLQKCKARKSGGYQVDQNLVIYL